MAHDKADWMQTLTGAHVRIRTAGSETDNRLTVIEFTEPPHSDPTVFTRHEFIEVFQVVSGTLCFQFLDETRLLLKDGDSVTCSRYKPHAFWNETDLPVHLQLICSPAGLDQFFIESDALLKSPDANLEQKRKALRDQYGLEHLPSAPARAG